MTPLQKALREDNLQHLLEEKSEELNHDTSFDSLLEKIGYYSKNPTPETPTSQTHSYPLSYYIRNGSFTE